MEDGPKWKPAFRDYSANSPEILNHYYVVIWQQPSKCREIPMSISEFILFHTILRINLNEGNGCIEERHN